MRNPTRQPVGPRGPGLNARRGVPRGAAGFTLVELLTTISIIALLIGITFPIISSMQSGSRIQAGLNTIGMSADVARQWVAPSKWEADLADPIPGASYTGTAAIYCPTGEVRIVANLQRARDQRGNAYLETAGLNGYRDRESVDYISIPDGTGVVGIFRNGGGGYRLLAPPFAIAFDEAGHLYMGDDRGLIYYDSDYNGRFDTSSDRNRGSGGYNPAQWDGAPGSRNADVSSADNPVRELPFESIECVAGVIIYDADDFANAGFDLSGGGALNEGSNAADWLRENGETLFFSPHTGVALRDEGE